MHTALNETCGIISEPMVRGSISFYSVQYTVFFSLRFLFILVLFLLQLVLFLQYFDIDLTDVCTVLMSVIYICVFQLKAASVV